MGKQIDTDVNQIIVTDKNLEKKFYDFDYDEDINGNNGEDYLSEEARQKGFESDLELIISNAVKKTKRMVGEEKVREFADEVLSGIKERGGDYYEGSDMKVLKVGANKFVVTFFRQTNW